MYKGNATAGSTDLDKLWEILEIISGLFTVSVYTFLSFIAMIMS